MPNRTTMSAHNKEVIDLFCQLCDWLMQIWQMRKFLFDENPDVGALKTARHQAFFYRLQEVLQEHWLHQLVKLHDPAVQSGHINLSLEYIIEYGQWEAETEVRLVTLKSRLDMLAKPLRDARNRILSHNDLATLLAGSALGTFDPDADERYFEALRDFASVVREAALGEPFVYDDMVRNDVRMFMHTFLRGTRT
jgi:hypothetical protein